MALSKEQIAHNDKVKRLAAQLYHEIYPTSNFHKRLTPADETYRNMMKIAENVLTGKYVA